MLWVASWVWVFVYKNHTIKDNVLRFRAAFCGENRLVSLKGKGGKCSFSQGNSRCQIENPDDRTLCP